MTIPSEPAELLRERLLRGIPFQDQSLADPAILGGVCMSAGTSSARQVRAQHRHELRTLTYVTIEQSNGGIVRNLSHNGMGVQMAVAVRPRQQLRIRFELRYPRLRVETRGEVIWATFSGQCGIRFLNLSSGTRRQINEWIFGDLLEGISLHPDRTESMFPVPSPVSAAGDEAVSQKLAAGGGRNDGLMVSASPLNVIQLPMRREPMASDLPHNGDLAVVSDEEGALDWLSQPLSPRGVGWAVDALVVTAALLLFFLVFLAITGESPPRPFAMAGGAAMFVAAMYWGFFRVVGGESFGTKLARLAEHKPEGESADAGFPETP